METPELVVRATWPGASPRQMERRLTTLLERQALKVAGTRRVESVTTSGTTQLRLTLDRDRPVEYYAAELRDRLEAFRPSLPESAEFHIERQVPEAFRQFQGFMTVQLVGPLPSEQLRGLADELIAPRLASLSGIRQVQVTGGRELELVIKLSSGKLAALGLGLGDVFSSLVEARSSRDYGRLDGLSEDPLLLAPSTTSLEQLRHLDLLPTADQSRVVPLGDVAWIGLRPAPMRQISRIDGQPVIALQLERAPDSHILNLAEQVRQRLAEMEERLPPGTRLLIAEDQSLQIREELQLLAFQGGLGVLLVSLLLALLLHSVRACLFVLGSVTVALSVAFLLLQPFGLTLNLITLAGLVLLFGLMADNGLIVTEELLRRRPRGSDWPLAHLEVAVRRTLRQVALPLVGGTLTTVAVLIPLAYVSGELRQLFVPFVVLLSLALLTSLISAAVVIPVLFRHWPPRHRPATFGWRRLRRWIDRPLRLAARHPKLTLLAVLLLIGTPVNKIPQRLEPLPEDATVTRKRLHAAYDALFSRDQERSIRPLLDRSLGGVLRPFLAQLTLGKQVHLPQEPEVLIRFELPQGTPMEQLERLMAQLEATARGMGGVRQIIGLATESQGFLRIRFTDEALSNGQATMVRQALDRTAAQRAGLRLNITGIEKQPFTTGFDSHELGGHLIRATGFNYDRLDDLVEGLASQLERHPRISGVRRSVDSTGAVHTRETLLLPWGPEAKARTGLDTQSATLVLGPALQPRRAHLRMDLEDRAKLPVRIIIRTQKGTELEALLHTPIPIGPDQFLLLSEVSRTISRFQAATIERSNQQYLRYLSIPFRGPPKLAEKVLAEVVESYPVPPGYEITIVAADNGLSDDVDRQLFALLLGTGAVVFLVLVLVLESWRGPLAVALGSASGFVGLGIGFLWADVAFAEGALLGLVMLIGIVVNDGVLLVDRIRFLRQARPGQAPSLLARLAVRQRLRPMWTTTLTTVCGLLPLLVMDVTHEFWTGFALTVVGGLLSATLLAPLIIVALSSLRGITPAPASVG